MRQLDSPRPFPERKDLVPVSRETRLDTVPHILQKRLLLGKELVRRLPALSTPHSRNVWVALLALSAMVLLFALLGLYQALRMPATRSREVPLVQYRQEGRLFYTVELKPNGIFDTRELDPGRVYITRLTERINVSYTYRFTLDVPPQRAQFVYQVVAKFGYPDIWQKQLVLVPATVGGQEQTLRFAIPVAELVELLDAFRREVGVSPGTPVLDVTVRVDPAVETAPSLIAEPFEHTVTFRFEGEVIRPEGDVERLQRGTVTQSVVVPNRGRTLLLALSVIGTLFGVGMVVVAGQRLNVAGDALAVVGPDRELARARRHSTTPLVRVTRLPLEVTEAPVVVTVETLDDLLRLAEELWRPVLYTVQEGNVTYCVVDVSGSICYLFARHDENPSTSARQ